MLAQGMERLHAAGVAVEQPVWLFGTTVVLSNLVSNVPAVMLLLPAATHPQAGAILALASTLAGNLFIVGSIANIIVIDQAERLGIRITWREHARVAVFPRRRTVLSWRLAVISFRLTRIREVAPTA
jgi:Na+/H+ antiporter NhaD/arsenite permease-like protein